MDENSKYYHISESNDEFILDDRVELNLKEILIYPVAIFLFIYLGTHQIIPAIALGLLVAILYTILRFFSWFIYKEIVVSKKDGTIKLRKMFMSKAQSTDLIDKAFDFAKLNFEEHSRSGKRKFLLQYKTHKTQDLFVIKDELHKHYIEAQLKGINTNHNID